MQQCPCWVAPVTISLGSADLAVPACTLADASPLLADWMALFLPCCCSAAMPGTPAPPMAPPGAPALCLPAHGDNEAAWRALLGLLQEGQGCSAGRLDARGSSGSQPVRLQLAGPGAQGHDVEGLWRLADKWHMPVGAGARSTDAGHALGLAHVWPPALGPSAAAARAATGSASLARTWCAAALHWPNLCHRGFVTLPCGMQGIMALCAQAVAAACDAAQAARDPLRWEPRPGCMGPDLMARHHARRALAQQGLSFTDASHPAYVLRWVVLLAAAACAAGASTVLAV